MSNPPLMKIVLQKITHQSDWIVILKIVDLSRSRYTSLSNPDEIISIFRLLLLKVKFEIHNLDTSPKILLIKLSILDRTFSRT